jgi:hypothetical protein
MMTALLFTPFLPLVLALSLGLWAKDRALLRHGAVALLGSTALAVGAVAAAAQYAIYPVWIGLSLTFGFPESPTTLARLGALGVNLTTIALMALLTYATFMRRGAP